MKNTPSATAETPSAGLRTGIQSRINGKDFHCEIPRSTLPIFEGTYGSANALFNRIRAGAWTSEELAAVIDFAIKPPKPGTDPFAFHVRTQTSPPTTASDAFALKGCGHYVALAVGILAAALFGLPADAATFTDEDIANG